MRILYVISGGDIGGAQMHVFYLSKWFAEKGHDISVVVGEYGPFVDLLEKHNIHTVIIPISRKIEIKRDLHSIKLLARFIRKGEYNIIHSHSSKAGIIARIAGFINRVPKNIFTAHGFVFTDPTLSKKKRQLYLILEKLCSWLSTDIITVSKYDLKKAVENKLNEKKIHVIYNGIPTDIILSDNKLEQKLHSKMKDEKQIIGFVGRFVSEKNIDMFLRVAALFKQYNNSNVEFWLIGDGHLSDHYKQLAADSGLGKIVKFKGGKTDILSWMDQMHVMLITSHKEGLPYVMLEALSRGIPIVSTNAGGIKEIIDPIGEKKVVVPINSDLEMFNRVMSLLDDKKEYEYIARDSIRIAKTLTAETMCSQTDKIYKSRYSEIAEMTDKSAGLQSTI